jgi:hypothetical protein
MLFPYSLASRRRLVLGASLIAVLLAALAAEQPAHAQSRNRTGQDWQQEVAYEMDVILHADRHRMRGTQRLRYTNNSPDTLRRVFYHLYFNAFQPQSMMAERNRELPDPDGRVVPRIFNLGPDEIGYHRVLSLRQDGRALAYDIDDTVMEVALADPLLPGEATTLTMRFRSQVPLQTRRSGRDNAEGIDYSMTQWYPKLAEYDAQGWHADPYVGREFYAPYGTFEVDITLPARYTIGATGQLQNPDDIGHGYGERGGGLWRPNASDYAPTDSLTWRYYAENVHDFAWAADPDYLHRRVEGDPAPGADFDDPSARGVTYHLLYQPGVADGWEPMASWVPDLSNFFSGEYGPYPYPQFTVAQGGDGGMEYPMITLITGRRSPGSLLGVTAHEFAHEWFYSVLGTNEADYPWMDEGFASYATEEGVAHVRDRPADHASAYLSVMRAHDLGLFERFNTPADWFETNLGYGVASYSGGEMFVDMLGYVIGDENLERFLDEYYRRFKFRHPQPDDLEKIAEDVSGLQLDWYFEQFLQTEREHDYALDELRAVQNEAGEWIAEITLERDEPIVMPADVRIELDDGTAHWATVPLTIMQGHKPVPQQWTVAEAWPWTFEEHTIRVPVPGRPVKAEIDPEGRSPDENRLNNSTHLRIEPRFLQAPGESWANYRLGYRPLFQFANDFGVAAGLQARGQYLFGKHRVRAMFKLWPQPLVTGGEEPGLLPDAPPFRCPPNTICNLPGEHSDLNPDVSAFDGFDYELSYQTEVEALGAEAEAGVRFEKHLGLMENTLFFERPLAEYGADAEQTLSLALIHQLNPTDRTYSADYSGAYDHFTIERIHARNPRLHDDVLRALNPFRREHMVSIMAGYDVRDGTDYFSGVFEAGTSLRDDRSETPFLSPTGGQSALRLRLDAQKGLRLNGVFTGAASFSFGLGAQDLALHKQFRLGAASFEERWRSDAFRTTSAAFSQPVDEAHLVAFRGAGPVAYAGRELSEQAPDALAGAPVGRGLVAGSLTLTVRPFAGMPYLDPLRLEAFSGIGEVWSGGAFLSGLDDLDADAGLGLRYDVASFACLRPYTAQSDVLSGLDLVVKLPFWASDPGRIERGSDDEWAFRWRLGIAVTP